MAIFTSGIESKIRQQVIPYLSPPVKSMLSSLPGKACAAWRNPAAGGASASAKIGDTDYGVAEMGAARNYEKGYVVGEEDLQRTMAAISESSLYALEEELKRGFITLRGGHRVGLAGRVVLARGDIKTMRDFGGLAFRIAREVVGCGTSLLGRLWRGNGQLLNTLIISPPRCGKTTLLRDLTRQLASGSGGINVALVDERSEIAACYRGSPAGCGYTYRCSGWLSQGIRHDHGDKGLITAAGGNRCGASGGCGGYKGMYKCRGRSLPVSMAGIWRNWPSS